MMGLENRMFAGRQRTRSRRNALRTLRRRDTIGLLLLGKIGSGKTSLVQRWINNTYDDVYNPTVEEFHVKPHRNLGQCVNVGLIDMTGSWDFSAMMDLYLSRVDSVIFVYDVTDESSIDELSLLHERLLKIRGENYDTVLTIVGTKIDEKEDSEIKHLKCIVDDFIKKRCESSNHVLTSAKLNVNIQETFNAALNDLVGSLIPNEDAIKRLGKIMRKNEGGCTNSCAIL